MHNHPDAIVRARRRLSHIHCLDGIRTVLDIGCGSGVLVKLLNEQGYRADGIDADAGSVRKSFANTSRVSNLDLYNISPSVQYDCVVLSHIIEHLGDPEGVLRRVSGWLRPGGYLYIACPNVLSVSPSGWRSSLCSLVYGAGHRHTFSVDDLRGLVSRSGMDIVYSDTWMSAEIMATCIMMFVGKILKPALPERTSIGRDDGDCIRLSIAEMISYSPLSIALRPFARVASRRGHEIVVIGRKSSESLPRRQVVPVSA